MCLGLPMRVERLDGMIALCTPRTGREPRRVSVALLDPPAVGDWVLVLGDTAHRSLTETEARQIDQALEALSVALAGGSVDHLFPDLADRPPSLPPHLMPPPPEPRS